MQSMDELFGQLRSLFQGPKTPASGAVEKVLRQAYELDSGRYEHEFKAYLQNLTLPEFMLESAEELEDIHRLLPPNNPCCALHIEFMEPEKLEGFFDSTCFLLLKNLYLVDCDVSNGGLQEITSSPYLANLIGFELDAPSPLEQAEALALCGARFFENLELLDLRGSEIDAQALETILHHPKLTKLQIFGMWYDVGKEGARVIATSPHVASLTTLRLGFVMDEDMARELTSSPLFTSLEALDFSYAEFAGEAWSVFTQHASIPNLRILDLKNTNVSDAGIEALVQASFLTKLEELNLSENRIGDEGMKALSSCSSLASLRRLELTYNQIAGEGCKALVTAPFLDSIEILYFYSNPIGDEGLGALLTSERQDLFFPVRFGQKRRFSLSASSLTSKGIDALASSNVLQAASSLELARNNIGDEGFEILVNTPHTQHIEYLDVTGCDLSSRAMFLFRAATHLKSLKQLNFNYNYIGNEGVMHLAQSAHIASVWYLSLENTNMGDAGLLALSESPHVSSLRMLQLRQNTFSDEAIETFVNSPRFSDGLTVYFDTETYRITKDA